MLAPLRVLVGALLSAVVLVSAVLAFSLGTQEGALEPSPLLAVPVLAAVGSVLLAETIGFRPPPIVPGTAKSEAIRLSRAAYQTGTITRFAFTEGAWLVTIGLAFSLGSGGYLAVLVSGAITLATTFFECWPRERLFARTQTALERDGGVSHLREALGLRTDTVIQEL